MLLEILNAKLLHQILFYVLQPSAEELWQSTYDDPVKYVNGPRRMHYINFLELRIVYPGQRSIDGFESTEGVI